MTDQSKLYYIFINLPSYVGVMTSWVCFTYQERELFSHIQQRRSIKILVSQFICHYLLKDPSMCRLQKLINDLWSNYSNSWVKLPQSLLVRSTFPPCPIYFIWCVSRAGNFCRRPQFSEEEDTSSFQLQLRTQHSEECRQVRWRHLHL